MSIIGIQAQNVSNSSVVMVGRTDAKDYVTAAARDAVKAIGTVPGTPLHSAAVSKCTRALIALDNHAADFGPIAREAVWAGYFKLSANEPHRLVKLVDSIIELGRIESVIEHLVAYADTH